MDIVRVPRGASVADHPGRGGRLLLTSGTLGRLERVELDQVTSASAEDPVPRAFCKAGRLLDLAAIL